VPASRPGRPDRLQATSGHTEEPADPQPADPRPTGLPLRALSIDAEIATPPRVGAVVTEEVTVAPPTFATMTEEQWQEAVDALAELMLPFAEARLRQLAARQEQAA
jgi:hypothetical protein